MDFSTHEDLYLQSTNDGKNNWIINEHQTPVMYETGELQNPELLLLLFRVDVAGSVYIWCTKRSGPF